jgi:hypothetical protein
MTSKPSIDSGAKAPQAVVDLCAGLLPVWTRHLAASRMQSEAAVTSMLQAFAGIGQQLQQLQQFQRQSDPVKPVPLLSASTVEHLLTVCEQRLSPLIEDEALPQGYRQTLREVLKLVHATAGTAAGIDPNPTPAPAPIDIQIEAMYAGFQYQDRISQMMALLESDMLRMQQVLDGGLADIPQIGQWLAQLESQYAMAEQRLSHHGTPGADTPGGRETDFF